MSSTWISAAVERADGGTWEQTDQGERPYGGPRGARRAGSGVVETEVEEERWDCVWAPAGRQSVKSNKKQHRAFLIPLCILALLQVTLKKTLQRKPEQIHPSVAMLHPVKSCFSEHWSVP